MKVGLYFGSFNPPHVGHGIVGETALDQLNCDEVWFIVSPQNPFKEQAGLLDENARFDLVQLALEANEDLKAFDIEFDMPRPSYTIDTLDRLRQEHPRVEFVIIMGSDNVSGLSRWKSAERLQEEFAIAVYDRPGSILDDDRFPEGMVRLNAPLLDLSSTSIRKALLEGRPCGTLMQAAVYQRIEEKGYYR